MLVCNLKIRNEQPRYCISILIPMFTLTTYIVPAENIESQNHRQMAQSGRSHTSSEAITVRFQLKPSTPSLSRAGLAPESGLTLLTGRLRLHVSGCHLRSFADFQMLSTRQWIGPNIQMDSFNFDKTHQLDASRLIRR